MKLKIEKLTTGAIKIEAAPDSGTKPLSITLEKVQIDGVLQMLDAVRRADRLKLEMDLP